MVCGSVVVAGGVQRCGNVRVGIGSANEIFNRNTTFAERIGTNVATIPDIDAYKLLALTIVSSLSAGITMNALFAFGEEIAWRGWLLKQFEGVKFLKISLIIGAFWGIWHAPLIAMGHNYAQHPFIGLVMMIIWCTLLTPIIQYIRIKSKSVITAAIFHGTLNAGAGLSLMYLDNFNDLLGGSAGLAGFLVLLVINCSLFAIDKWVTKENIFTKELSLE